MKNLRLRGKVIGLDDYSPFETDIELSEEESEVIIKALEYFRADKISDKTYNPYWDVVSSILGEENCNNCKNTCKACPTDWCEKWQPK